MRQSGVFSPKSGAMNSVYAPGFRGLQSNMGSQARFKKVDQSDRRSSALRITRKVDQIRPPESESEQSISAESNDEGPQKSPETKKINPKSNIVTLNTANFQSATSTPMTRKIAKINMTPLQ